ncbi:Uncharacterized protein OBRU01_03367 [Operophtera brumata]|uniref:C2H2-type domain-containing protein n=1 Tax=Operophtera brumata TaxID=104452 RepID=A0A0L7LR04_OPEBR|nr:Uncharacterized protein OBRU01_03367 [Operophtera brumata]
MEPVEIKLEPEVLVEPGALPESEGFDETFERDPDSSDEDNVKEERSNSKIEKAKDKLLKKPNKKMDPTLKKGRVRAPLRVSGVRQHVPHALARADALEVTSEGGLSSFVLRYECPVCANVFHTRWHVQMHLKSHQKEGL